MQIILFIDSKPVEKKHTNKSIMNGMIIHISLNQNHIGNMFMIPFLHGMILHDISMKSSWMQERKARADRHRQPDVARPCCDGTWFNWYSSGMGGIPSDISRCWDVHVSVDLSIDLSIDLCNYLSMHSSIELSIYHYLFLNAYQILNDRMLFRAWSNSWRHFYPKIGGPKTFHSCWFCKEYYVGGIYMWNHVWLHLFHNKYPLVI